MTMNQSDSPLTQATAQSPGGIAPRWMLVLIIVLIWTAIATPFLLPKYTGWNERRQSFALLAAAEDREELMDAVTRLGVVLDLPDGEWIAIRYRDSHAWYGYSIAVALTSDGCWLESWHHFCGQFAHYRNNVARLQEAQEHGDPGFFEVARSAFEGHEHMQAMRRIETQCSLDQAVEELLGMHFVVSSETRPAQSVNASH